MNPPISGPYSNEFALMWALFQWIRPYVGIIPVNSPYSSIPRAKRAKINPTGAPAEIFVFQGEFGERIRHFERIQR